MFGALDQDWHPEEECRPPNAEFLEQRFANAKAMGLNTLRCHVKIPDPLYFELADRLGLIVWLDMPYMEFLAPATREDLRRVFQTSVATHGHHRFDCNLDAVQRGMGYRSRRQSGRPALADRDLRLGEDAGPGEPACRQFPLLSAQLPPQDRDRGFPLVQRFSSSERGFRRDDSRLCRARGLDLLAAWRRRAPRRRTADLFGIRRVGAASSARDPGGGRKRALVVRERARLEPRRRLSARTRDAFSRRAACANIRRRRWLCERGAGASISRAQAPDRDAALGAGNLRLCHHRAQRRAVGVQRPHGRSEPPARLCRALGRTSAAMAHYRADAADGRSRRRAL